MGFLERMHVFTPRRQNRAYDTVLVCCHLTPPCAPAPAPPLQCLCSHLSLAPLGRRVRTDRSSSRGKTKCLISPWLSRWGVCELGQSSQIQDQRRNCSLGGSSIKLPGQRQGLQPRLSQVNVAEAGTLPAVLSLSLPTAPLAVMGIIPF